MATERADDGAEVLPFRDVAAFEAWLDANVDLQKYVPRRPRSNWSRLNVRKVGELTAAGRMRPSGQAEVDAAKADGRWAAALASD